METVMNDLSVEAKALVARARDADGPGPERRARVKRAVAAALIGASASLGTAGTVAAAGSAAKSALTASSVALWLGMGAAIGTVVSVPSLVVRLTQSEPLAHSSAPVTRPAPVLDQPAANTPVTPLKEPLAATGAPDTTTLARPEAKALTSAAPVDAGPSLTDETRLLEAAQRELASGRARSALSLLEEHERRFPAGALGEERTAARVLSLCALGRGEEARRTATTFLETSPRSPLIPRLRGSCALDGKADDEIPAR
jgi:hypothetical protein